MNLLYSETISLFLKKVKQEARSILKHEMGLHLGRQRFWVKQTGYPLHFVVFEHPSKCGYFDPEMYEVGINKCYLFESDEALRDLLRHELAHYITFIEHGVSVPHHGKEFHAVCKRYGCKAEVARATTQPKETAESLRILQRVQKLLALSSSHHAHEAEAALVKARELLLKYHIENVSLESEEMEMHRLIKQKRCSAKLHAIASILKHFFVYTVFNHGKGCVYLEVFGSSVNVEIATYVGRFLEREFEELWKLSSLKGLRAKNSFFRGIAKGYDQKMHPLPREKGALIQLNHQLTHAASQAYPHLAKTSMNSRIDSNAAKVGLEKGKNLSIRPGIQKSTATRAKIGFSEAPKH